MPVKLPFDPTESIQATRMAWAIERYIQGELTADQIEATHEFDPGYGVKEHLRRFRMFHRPIDEVLAYEPDPIAPRARIRSGNDMAIVSLRLGDAPERRIVLMGVSREPAPGVTTRSATESDAIALRNLERRTAVETGGVSMYYDRGDDYFAQQRLMPHHISSVAEYQGRIVGVSSDALRPIRIAGTEYRASYRFHLRVDPDARGIGVMPALNRAQSSLILVDRPIPIASSFVAAENAQMLAALGPEQSGAHWGTHVERMVLSCCELAGPAFGRPAVPADAPRIAQLLAASHAGEELALDFDPAWVEERFSRSRRDYSWGNVLVSENAILGVWDSGLRVIRADASGMAGTRTATALDWGFIPGAGGELEALLRVACTTLSSAGVDDLIIFSSPPSRGRDHLAALARTVDRFRVSTTGIQPRDAATIGIYVDPIYF